MSNVRFIVDMRMNLFCHFIICTDIHRYLKNRYYREQNYALFDEESYSFVRDEMLVYCLELLLKIVSDHPQFDQSCIENSLNSYLFAFLNAKATEYLKYWHKVEVRLLALKQLLDKEWSSVEDRLPLAIEKIMRERVSIGNLRIFLVDAFYGRKEDEGVSSCAEVNVVDKDLLLICVNESYEVLRIIIHEIIHRPLSNIIGQIHYEMKLPQYELTIISETFARLIEKEVCNALGVLSMTEEEIRENVEILGFLDFYHQCALAWQDYIKDETRPSLKEFMTSQVAKNKDTLRRCKYFFK